MLDAPHAQRSHVAECAVAAVLMEGLRCVEGIAAVVGGMEAVNRGEEKEVGRSNE